ncbi:hypothetical protein F8388_022600 [Cannabis sativa]|uniref:Transposase-associated domain-containing protein n=1 Tax=Cannabis sativa TaxID=3483 RepID=A0A7J6G224_CANSA|nr:hypothetical protein F8388_022600 [Cannabis sativa]
MDRHWINIPNKLSAEYAAGMNEFISVARHSMDSNGMVLCPCCRCVNKKSQYMHVIKLHLIIHGFLSSYTRWYHHGEQIEEVEDEGLFDTEDNVEDSNHDDLDAGLHDDIGSKYFDIGPTSDFNDESPFNVDDKSPLDDVPVFRHEKTKKKCGSYRGGQIDLYSHSILMKEMSAVYKKA